MDVKTKKAQDPKWYPDETKERREKENKKQTNTDKELKTAHIKECNRWARAYREIGANVIPIKYKSKSPNISTWIEFQKKKVPEETFENWIKNNKFENIAILGGHVSQDLVCFDIDDPKDFKNLQLGTDKLIADGAWVTETPKERGRYHIVIRDKNEITSGRLEKHIDYRANDCYWLVYPSIHPVGKQYNFLNTRDPKQLKLPSKRNTMALFETWNDILNQKKGTKKAITATVESKEDFDNSPDCIRNAFKLGATPGMRYYVAQSLSSYLQQQKFPLEMAQEIIINWFNTKCNTEGRPIKDIKKAVTLVYKKKKYAMGCRYWRNKTTFCPYEKMKDCPFYQAEPSHTIEVEEKNIVDEISEKQIAKSQEKDLFNDNSLIGLARNYYDKCTNAPWQFGVHMTIHIIGHAMGVNSVHMIQPRAMHHNTYVVLIGPSTLSRKTTSQDLGMGFCMQNSKLPTSFSPQGLLKAMTDQPHAILALGEFSSVLRGIKFGGNMADLKEIMNELHRCPPEYEKRLVKIDKSYKILDPYLCVSTTCTPEEFKSNVTEEIIYGGFLARFIMVPGNSTYRPREKITPDNANIERELRRLVNKTYDLFNQPQIEDWGRRKYVEFEFSDDGLKEFNRIDKMLTTEKKWDDVKPFVGRYLDYIITYADILFISDLIGIIGREKWLNIDDLDNLDNLEHLEHLEHFALTNNKLSSTQTKPSKSSKSSKSSKCSLSNCYRKGEKKHYFTVPAKYVTLAWRIISPSLDFTKELVRYLNEDVKIARLKTVLEKHAPTTRSYALRNTHLLKKDFDDALNTMKDRSEAFELYVKSMNAYDKESETRVYCLKSNIGTKKCTFCPYKCTFDQRHPQLSNDKGVVT